MNTPSSGPGDPYARVEYRRVIAWKRRIEREGPWLLRLLHEGPAEGPDRAVVDLGAGTGEHVAFFARSGARAVGIDQSETMIAAAREHEARGEGRFFEGDVRAPPAAFLQTAPFDLAICLGNVLPHLLDVTDLTAFLSTAHSILKPGGLLLIQIVNYTRLRVNNVRSLPVNVRPGEREEAAETADEIVFVRVLRHLGDRRWLFFPTTLTLEPDRESPVEVHSSRQVELRGWEHDDLTTLLETLGFDVQLHGDMHGGPFDAENSHDVIVVATRR